MSSKKKKIKNIWTLEESKIYFDKNNSNVLMFEGLENGQSYSIVIPPGKNRVDLLHFQGICGFRLKKGYDPHYMMDFQGLMIISQQRVRKVMLGSKVITKTKI